MLLHSSDRDVHYSCGSNGDHGTENVDASPFWSTPSYHPPVAREQPRKNGPTVPVEFADLPRWLREEGPVAVKPLKDQVRLRRETFRLVDDTHAIMARLDEAVYRSGAGPALVLLTRLRDVQAAAQLRGVAAMLRRVLLLEVPSPARQPINPQLLRGLVVDQAAVAFVLSGRPVDATVFVDSGLAAGLVVQSRTTARWLGPAPASAYGIAVSPGRRMGALSDQCWTWMDTPGGLPVVAKMALALAQLTLLAPMTGFDHLPQLSVLLQLIRLGVLRDQVLPMSSWLMRRGAAFRTHLRAYIAGETDAWVAFFAQGVLDACRHQMRLIARLDEIRDELLSPFSREDRFRDVVGGMIGHPITNRHHLAVRYDISVNYASQLIDRLLEEKLVERLEPASVLQQVDDKRWATVVFNPDIVTLLSRLLPLPQDGDLPE